MRRLGLSLLFLLLLACPVTPGCPAQRGPVARAASEAPWPVAGICVQPANPNTTIALRSVRTEITLREVEGHTQARVWSRFSLVNPSRTTPVQAVVGLPTWSAGDRYFRSKDIQGLTVTVNDTPVTPTARPRPGVENETWLAWDISFDILDRQFVEVTYTVPLEAGPVPRVAFALSSGAAWAGQVESAAVVVTPPTPFQREQILDARPADAQYDGRQLGWHFVSSGSASLEDVGFTYVTRGLWARVEAARAAVAAEESAANHRTLGLLYLTLVGRGAFFAEAVAELEAAARLDPANVETQRALAQVYQARGLALNDGAYLELAVRYWDRVRALVPGDTEASANLRGCHYVLAQTLVTQQAYRQAVEHLDAALALPATGSDVSDAALRELRDRAQRSWAAHLFAAGRSTEAIAVLRALGDPYEADYRAYAPALAGLEGHVSTRIARDGGVRYITVAWTPFWTGALTDTAALGKMIQTQVPEAQVRVLPGEQGMEVALAFTGPAELREMLTSLGQGVPTDAVWDPVRAVLTAGDVACDYQDGVLWRDVRYRETLPLGASVADLVRQRQTLDATIADLTGRAGSLPEDPTALRLTALQTYRAVLGRLLATQVSYQVVLTDMPGRPQATLDVALDEDRVLEAGARQWNLLSLGLAGGGVALLTLLFLGLLGWRLAARRRPGAIQHEEVRMTKKRPKRDRPVSAPRAKSPSLVKQIAQQSEEETIARARDEARVREQRTEALGLGPDTHPASAPEGDSPAEPLTFVEQVAWRAEQEAIDRGSDELRAQRRLAESLGLVPAPSTEDPKKQT